MKTFIFFMGTFPRRAGLAVLLSGLFFWLLPEFEQAVDTNSFVYAGTVFLTMYLIAKCMFWTNCNHDSKYNELRWVPVEFFLERPGSVDKAMANCINHLYYHSLPCDKLVLLHEVKMYYDYRGWEQRAAVLVEPTDYTGGMG